MSARGDYFDNVCTESILQFLKIKTIILLFLLPNVASANISAPPRHIYNSSSELFFPGEGLTVEKEKLTIRCFSDQKRGNRCNVVALYTILSRSRIDLKFEFILPVMAEVSIDITDSKGNRQHTIADIKRNFRPRHIKKMKKRFRAIYVARFNGKLNTGKNSISIAYTQPMGTYIIDYSSGCYPIISRTINSLRMINYELWPLKEWSLAPDFRLRISISFHSADTGFFKKIFGAKEKLYCRGSDSKIFTRSKKEKENNLYNLEFRKDFPDHLECFIGHADKLKKL